MSVFAVVHPRPSEDEGERPCAALDGRLMAELGAQPGDILRVATARGRVTLVRLVEPSRHAKSPTAAVEAPPGSEAPSIRFDRLTRQVLRALPGERVSIEGAQPGPTLSVVLVPGSTLLSGSEPMLVQGIKAVLADDQTPVRAGMQLYIKLPGSRAGLIFHVHHVAGEEGRVTPQTSVYLEPTLDHQHGPGSGHQHAHSQEPDLAGGTTYDDVGGLDQQIRAVRESVELPLVFPRVYRQLGITPSRGVIFYGAPGTGKTLLARGVAQEVNARFYYVNGPELVGTFTGQTEENLRKVFGEASLSPPAIIFIDELDAVAPIRGSASTLSDARAVTQLLSLMDGLTRAEGVMVIGTTNRIEAIDPALRRAGRFDREVHFPTPTAEAREQILRVHTREMPLAPNAVAALGEIAHHAYGFVGADLMELSREAGLSALRRAAEPFLADPAAGALPATEELVVTRADFEAALSRVHPASMRDSLMTYPTVGWDDIGGLTTVKRRLRDLVEKPLCHPELFVRVGLPTNLGVLLHGPPGTGKTLLARAIARESGVNFIAIQGPELFSQWLGESEEAVRRVFNVARRAAPCIIFFDQLDALAPHGLDLDREGTRAPRRVVHQLLAEMDGMSQLSQVIVVGATSRVDAVDPAALRPGRFGLHLYVGLPDLADRGAILRVHLQTAAIQPGTDIEPLIERLAGLTEGFSGADLAFLCQRAKLHALDRVEYRGVPALATTDFDAVIHEIGTTSASAVPL